MLSIIACGPASAGQGVAARYEVTIEPGPGDYFEGVRYRLWLSDVRKPVRAILILQPGCGVRGSLSFVDDLQYQALARKWGLALLAADQWQSHYDCNNWMLPERGSGGAFLDALHRLARASRHSEIRSRPWLLWGHSGGGIWVTAMSAQWPDRVVAMVARSGALPRPLQALGSDAWRLSRARRAAGVPSLFLYGEKERGPTSSHNQSIDLVFDYYQAGGGEALWTIAGDPTAEHENADGRALTLRFFDEVLAHSPKLGGDGFAGRAWGGDLRAQQIWSQADQSPTALDLRPAWLPSAEFAKAWREFITTGAVVDTTPGPAPTDLTVSRLSDGVLLRWRAQADLESGIREFRIYGDRQLIARAASLRGPDGAREPYQHWNSNDQPSIPPDEIDMRWPWRGGAHAVYAVSAVNWSGVESALSIPAPNPPPSASCPGQGRPGPRLQVPDDWMAACSAGVKRH